MMNRIGAVIVVNEALRLLGCIKILRGLAGQEADDPFDRLPARRLYLRGRKSLIFRAVLHEP